MPKSLTTVAVLLSFVFPVNGAHPIVFRIVSAASVNGNEIGLCFSDRVDLRSAGDSANYRLSDTNIVVTNTIVRVGNRSVLLQLSRPIVGFSFVLMAPDVRSYELAPPANPIVAGAVLGHDTDGFDNTDIGTSGIDPQQQGSVFGCTGRLFQRDFEVVAGGSGMGGQSDAFHFVYHRGHQIFDAFTQITDLTTGYGLAQAGLMARTSLDPQSRHVSILVTFGTGAPEISTRHRATNSAASAEWPGAQKLTGVSSSVWLRLRRDGPKFSAFASANAVDWVTLGEIDPSPAFPTWPDSIFVGAAASSSNNTATAQLQFRYRVDPHGDVFPRIEVSRQLDRLTLRWANVFAIEESDLLGPLPSWTSVTNNVQFGTDYNEWTNVLPPSANHRFFRVRFPETE